MNKRIIYFITLSYFITMILTMFISIGIDNDISQAKSSNSFTMDRYLFLIKSNLFVYLLLILGLITFKVTTIINIISNGISMGYFLPFLIKYGGFSFLIHAIPELLGLFIGAYIGLSKWSDIKVENKKYIFLFITGILLILISGILETYVTPIFYS